MSLLLKYIYVPILLWGGYSLYEAYQSHQVEMLDLKSQKETEEIRVRKAKRNLKEIEEFKKNLEESEKNFAKIQQELDQLREKLPAQKNTSEVLELVGNTATELQLKNQNLSLGEEVDREDYIKESYQFKARGTFPQIIVFLERIQDTTRIIDFGQVEIKRVSENESSRYNYLDIKNAIFSYRYSERKQPENEEEAPDE